MAPARMLLAGSCQVMSGNPTEKSWSGIACIKPRAPAGEMTLGSPVDSTRIIAAMISPGTPVMFDAARISGSQRNTGSSRRGGPGGTVGVGETIPFGLSNGAGSGFGRNGAVIAAEVDAAVGVGTGGGAGMVAVAVAPFALGPGTRIGSALVICVDEQRRQRKTSSECTIRVSTPPGMMRVSVTFTSQGRSEERRVGKERRSEVA